jgi:hypothetical protein
MAKATTVVNGLPGSGPSARGRHPYLYGMFVALLMVIFVAVPFVLSAFVAAIWLGGCTDSGSGPVPSQHGMFGPCPEPDRLKGTLAALVALVLFALPVIAGVLTARAVSRPPWSSRVVSRPPGPPER